MRRCLFLQCASRSLLLAASVSRVIATGILPARFFTGSHPIVRFTAGGKTYSALHHCRFVTLARMAAATDSIPTGLDGSALKQRKRLPVTARLASICLAMFHSETSALHSLPQCCRHKRHAQSAAMLHACNDFGRYAFCLTTLPRCMPRCRNERRIAGMRGTH